MQQPGNPLGPAQRASIFESFVSLVPQIAPTDLSHQVLTAETTLGTDLMLDSISMLSLVALTEERFGISLADHTDALANMLTIGDAVALIETLISAKH
ncbi:Meromycolate extension acyl carrier protein [compost metagenome]